MTEKEIKTAIAVLDELMRNYDREIEKHSGSFEFLKRLYWVDKKAAVLKARTLLRQLLP